MSTLKKYEREIGELKVCTTQLRPRRAMRLSAKLIKYIMPALVETKGLKVTDDIDFMTLLPAIIAMVQELSEDELDRVLTESLSGTVVIGRGEDGKPAKYDLSNPAKIDDAFDGNMSGMLACVQCALEINFGDFFAGSGSKKPPTASAPAAESPAA